MIRLRVVGLALAAALGLGIAAACGDDGGLAYQPAAYGQQMQLASGQTYQMATNTGFQTVTVAQPQDSFVCWLADSYTEAALLIASGACPNSSIPILMASMSQGLYWHEMYAPYYDSYGYYGRYVPSAYRNTYVSHVTVFETHYHTQIVADESSSSARWKGSDGKTYNGSSVSKYMSSGKASFGSGSVRSAGFASSSLRSSSSGSSSSGSTRTTTSSGSSRTTTSGGSTRYSGGSSSGFGGGSRSTSSGSSRSYTSGSSSGFGGGSRSSYSSGSYAGRH